MRPSALTHLAFRPKADLTLDVPNTASRPRQLLRKGEVGLVRHRVLQAQLRGVWRANVDLLAEAERLNVQPLESLRTAAGRSVLFTIPSEALGDSVMAGLALCRLADRFELGRIGVAFTGKSSDVWTLLGRAFEVFPLILPERALTTFDLVIDLASEVPALCSVAETMVGADAAILTSLGLDAPTGWTVRPPREVRRIGILPLSSTPLRTLPPPLVAYLADELAGRGYTVEIVLDPRQRQGAVYHEALRANRAALRSDLDTVAAVHGFLRDLYYGIFCDSGPAHLAKLVDLPGYAIYTTIGGATVQGGFTNLARWQAAFAGPHCIAPCGLVGLMAPRAGEGTGCMDSLGLPREALVRPFRTPASAAGRFVVDHPVGCVASLVHDRKRILAAVLAHVQKSGLS